MKLIRLRTFLKNTSYAHIVSAFLLISGQHAVAQSGRVIIVDYSGSMVNPFGSTGATRMETARRALSSLLEKFRKEQDQTPTALLAFGSRFSWKDWKSRTGNTSYDPTRYPPPGDPGPGCTDINFIGAANQFSLIDRGFERSTNRQAGSLRPGGMTPLAGAFNKALNSLRANGYDDAKIFIISDFDEPNCQRNYPNFCAMIETTLSQFTSEGGRVQTVVIPIPTANIAKIANCTNAQEIKVDPTNADPTDSLNAERAIVTPVITIGSGDSLDGEGISESDLQIDLLNRTGGLEHRGNGGAFEILPGEYDVLAKVDEKVVRTNNVRVGGNSILPINLPNAIVELTSKDADGRAISVLDKLQISRGSGEILTTLRDIRLPYQIKLGHGIYALLGSFDGNTSELTVRASVGALLPAVLEFQRQSTDRDVGIEIDYVKSSLSDALAKTAPHLLVRPAISLVGPSGIVGDVSDGWSGTLPPGIYSIQIGRNLSQKLPVNIPAGRGLFEVKVDVVPGWFQAAKSPPPQVPGTFVLMDGSRRPLIEFKGSPVRHSLPDGQYYLEYRSGDNAPRTQAFEIVNGQSVEIRF